VSSEVDVARQKDDVVICVADTLAKQLWAGEACSSAQGRRGVGGGGNMAAAACIAGAAWPTIAHVLQRE
jgi:hypothetical protein